MKKRLPALFTAACLCLTAAGCAKADEQGVASAETPSAVVSDADMLTERDYETGYSDYVTITLSDGGSSADGGGVSVKGDVVTISREGAFLMTGSLSDGQIVVDTTDAAKVQLVLDNASVTNASSAAIYVKTADKVFVTQTDGSRNTLRVAGDYIQTDDNTVDAVIFAKSELTLNGGGTLTVQADYGHGVVSKDDLNVTGGSYALTSASGGLSGKDGVCIADGDFTIDAAGDAIHTDGSLSITGGSFTIASGDDGLHADGALSISGGAIDITRSYEGIEGAEITISGGTVNVAASDDGLNAAGGSDGSGNTGAFGRDGFVENSSASVLISGGTLTVDAQGDGIDSNGTLTVSGGAVYVNGPTSSANGALDCGGSAVVTGGVVVAAGSGGMAMNFGPDSTQGSILYHFSAAQPAGTELTLTAADGTVVVGFVPAKEYQCVVISAPEITAGSVYTLTAGSESAEIVMTKLIYGASGGMGGGMGMRRGDAAENRERFMEPQKGTFA